MEWRGPLDLSAAGKVFSRGETAREVEKREACLGREAGGRGALGNAALRVGLDVLSNDGRRPSERPLGIEDCDSEDEVLAGVDISIKK